MECIEPNCLRKHMENMRNSQASISMNFWSDLSKAGVTLCNLLHILCIGNTLMNVLWINIYATYL